MQTPPPDLPPAAAAFVRAVDAMVERQATLPRSIAYDVRVHVHSSGDRESLLHYELDVPAGTFHLSVAGGEPPLVQDVPYPLEPDFNALTDFYTSGEWRAGGRDTGRLVNDVRPLAIERGPDPGTRAVRGYSVRYAEPPGPEGPIRLALTADPSLERTRTVVRSVEIDPHTWLPRAVVLHTPFGRSTVTVEYTPIAGIPFVSRYTIRRTIAIPFGRLRLQTDATFEHIAFDLPRPQATGAP